mmetsp:Transcript_77/g.202  ORF Transcript_77/g.202 Transcript_77/m.202 type:complete len:212 (-) Transcript_77:20-655(-)
MQTVLYIRGQCRGRPGALRKVEGGHISDGVRARRHPRSRTVDVDRDCLRKLLSVRLMVGVRELQGDLVLPWLQLELPLRLRLPVVLVGGIHRDCLAALYEGCGSVDDHVVVASAFLEPSGSRRERVPGDLKLVRERARHRIAVLHVCEVHAVLWTLGTRGRRDGEHRGGGRRKSLPSRHGLEHEADKSWEHSDHHACREQRRGCRERRRPG